MGITYDAKKLKVVAIDEVRPNSWNPKEKDHPLIERIEQNIKRIGFNEPIRVRENEGYEIIDGEQRWVAAKNLGLKKVLVYNEGVVSDEDARNATLWWQIQIPFDQIKLAYEVNYLAEQGVELPYSTEEIEEFKAIAAFNFDEYEAQRPEIGEDMRTLHLVFEKDAYAIVMEAIGKVQAENDNITEARAIELICADYLGKP